MLLVWPIESGENDIAQLGSPRLLPVLLALLLSP